MINSSLDQSKGHFDALDESMMQTLLKSHDWIERESSMKFATGFGFVTKGKYMLIPTEPGEECCCIIKTIIPKSFIRTEHAIDHFYKVRACKECLYIIDLNDDVGIGSCPDQAQLHMIIRYDHIKTIKIGLKGHLQLVLKPHIYTKHKATIEKTSQLVHTKAGGADKDAESSPSKAGSSGSIGSPKSPNSAAHKTRTKATGVLPLWCIEVTEPDLNCELHTNPEALL